MHFQSIPMQSIVASDVMIPLNRLITLRSNMSAVEAMRLLLKNRISGRASRRRKQSILGGLFREDLDEVHPPFDLRESSIE